MSATTTTTSTSPVQPSVTAAARTASTATPPAANAPPASPARPSSSSRPYSARSRVNWRLVIMLSIVAVPFLWMGYMLVNQFVTGGVSRHGDYYAVDLKALGNFAFDDSAGTVAEVPERYRKLDGKKVELEGFMYSPQSAGERGTEFQFVYNVTKCCFSGPPLVQERVYGHVKDGSDVPLYDMYTFARVTGTLHVRVIRDEAGSVHSVYDLDVDKAEKIK
jgi:hypothetical protein